MQNIFNTSIQVLGSSTFGVILSLLLIFQWYKQHAKEQAVKNSLFAIRRKIERRIENQDFSSEAACDMLDDVDAVLATLGSRKPFEETLDKVFGLIRHRSDLEKNSELPRQNNSVLTTPFLGTANRILRIEKRGSANFKYKTSI